MAERSAFTVDHVVGDRARAMSKFNLYWVRTDGQYDDGFVVARTSSTAARFASGECWAQGNDWAHAERIAPLPEHLQDATVAVGATEDEPRRAHWASREVLSACGIRVVHSKPPRVFFRNNRLFTEGWLCWWQEAGEATGVSAEEMQAKILGLMIGRDAVNGPR